MDKSQALAIIRKIAVLDLQVQRQEKIWYALNKSIGWSETPLQIKARTQVEALREERDALLQLLNIK